MTQNKITRCPDGLINNKEYKFTSDGFVDWKAMIDPQFLYPNKDFFEIRKMQMPTSIEDLEDKALLIMLGGIKELARLRGFTSVKYSVNHVSTNYVVAQSQSNGWVTLKQQDNRSFLKISQTLQKQTQIISA